MKIYLILILTLLSSSVFGECFKTVGTKALYKPLRDYPNVMEKYEIKADGRFLASFEAAKNEEGETIYEAAGLEKINQELRESDFFKVDCPVGMR